MSSRTRLQKEPSASPRRATLGMEDQVSRRPQVRILFVHSNRDHVDRSLQELNRVGFAVTAEILSDPARVGVPSCPQNFDVVICEYSPRLIASGQIPSSLARLTRDCPLIFLGDGISREAAAALMLNGVAECVEIEAISHLPVAVRRVLSERSLRRERDRAEKELRRLEARYRALAGNLTYGICRCSPAGAFLDVNQALVSMLGYSSKEELLAMNIAGNIISDPAKRAQLLGQTATGGIDPVETDWVRKDGTSLKVRLSAQEVFGDHGQMDAYEIIVEDITKQRELEDHLRRLAASDPLTGLANYRHLIDALDMEIRRSNRTGREFALLMFDMDGLKQLNDSYGHMTGSQALCRTADALTLFCRDIDTAARFGGDEFALLLPETGAEAAYSVARRIGNSIAEDGNGPAIAVSVGVGVFPRDGETVEALVTAADTDMYAMKRKRKGELAQAESRT